MKALTIIIILSLLYINNSQLNSQEPREIFIDYLTKYKIVYDSKEDYDNHLNLFLQQYQNPEFNIEDFLNLKNKKKRRLTKTEDIFYKSKNEAKRHLAKDDDDILPDDFEWVGGINKVQNQGKCGACAVFSVMAAYEFYYFNKFHRKRKFSEQAVIDCFILNGDICDKGANIYYIYNFVENYWPMLEEDYPYISYNSGTITQFCKFNVSKTINITHPLLYQLNPSEKTGLISPYNIAYHIYHYGPVITLVNGDCSDFYRNFNNSKYVISSNDPFCDPTDLNHAIIITGWGFSSTDKLYWIVKNSWGKAWGDNGYGYILGGENSFGIESYVRFIADKLEGDTDTEDLGNRCTCNGIYLSKNYLFVIIWIFFTFSFKL